MLVLSLINGVLAQLSYIGIPIGSVCVQHAEPPVGWRSRSPRHMLSLVLDRVWRAWCAACGHHKMSQILTRRRSRQLNGSSDVTSGVGTLCGTSVKVEEDFGSDLFISDDDDVVDRDYVQPAHISSSDGESLPTGKEQCKKHKAMSYVSRLSDLESSDGVGRSRASGSRAGIGLESESSYQRLVKKKRRSYSSKDKKDFRWSLELLHTAVCEHRWEDAFSLLPCVITHTVPHLPLEFLWRMTDVITRNVPSLSTDDRKKFRSILHGMKLKTSMFLDTLSQDLAEATDKDVDELLQMIEDIQNQRLPPAMGIVIKRSKRFKALSDGYVGLVHYHCWKNSLLNAMSSSQPLDEDSWSMSFSESQGTTNTSKKEIVRRAHSFLKTALSGLNEPCDWFMLQYLELEQELNGQESAVSALERYKSDPRRAPAHHLAYHCYKNLVPGSVVEQLIELECISKVCSDDPLVLEQVNLYLHSLDHGGPALERAKMWMRSAESDSGQESNDDCPPGPVNTSCTLRKTGKVEVLMRCLMLLVGMLDYPCHTWNLKPWQKLTQVLTKFYQAWVKCWFCLACKKTRRRVHRLAQTVVPLWKHFVWKEPPASLSVEQANVLFHHVFAAFIFNYSDEYMSQSMSALVKNGHMLLKKELRSLMNFPGAFQKDFSLLAKEHRKRVEGISLRSLSQTAFQNKKAIQQNQKRTQDTSEAPTIISSHDLSQETHTEGPHDSGSECEDEVLLLTPFKDSVNSNILNQETGLSPRFLRNIFDTSFEGNFITSTQTKDEKCKDPKKLAEDPELNGTYITYQETDKENSKFTSISDAVKINDDHSSQSKTENCKRFPNITSTRKGFGDHTESNDKVDGKQDSNENMKYSKSTSVKDKLGKQKEKLPQSEESVPQPPAVCMRTRLSTDKTAVDSDQNCLPEDTGAISCLTHKLGTDRSVGDNRQHADCEKVTAHDAPLQVEEQKEHGCLDEAKSTCLKNPEKKRLLFDETLSTNTEVTKHDVNVALETSVGNTEDKNKCSVSSLSSAEDIPDTRTYSSELKSDKPENSTSGVDKKKRVGKKDRAERSKSQKVKHKLKNLMNSTEEKKNQTPSTEEKENKTPEHSIKSVQNKYQNPNASHIKGTGADGDSPRTHKWTRSENDMMYRTIVRETETQSQDEASDKAFQTVPETQSQDEASDDVSQTVPETQSQDEASDDTFQTAPETHSQLITSVNLSTEDRHTDETQGEENKATRRKQNEPVQEEENDEIRGKQNQEAQEKTKSKEQHCDVGKLSQSAQEERKSEEQGLNSTGQRKQKGVRSNSLEIDVSGVCNEEDSQSSLDTLTADQIERECTSSSEKPVPTSPCGQGFFVTQESKSGEPLLSPDGKRSGSKKPEHEDLNLDELKELDLVDLDHYLPREQKEQYYCESIKDEENSLEVHSWHSDRTPGGLLESVSVHQDHKMASRATTCVTEEETPVKDEEGLDALTEVQNFEKCSGSNHKSPQKLLEKSVPKEDSVDSEALPKKSQPFKFRLHTPSTKHPVMPWCMLHVEDLPTPSMLDIVKHSDTSTPNTREKQRQRQSGSSVTGTPKDTRTTRRRSSVPHHLASWLEGLPLPDTDNSTPYRKNKDSDAHETRFRIPEAVLSSTSPKKKTPRKSKNSLINSVMENCDSMPSGASTMKTEKFSKKKKENILACTDEGIADLKDLEDSISQCGKDREVNAEPATQISVPTAEESVTINNKQECETKNDMCVSVTDGLDDLPILRDTEVSLEASPENTSLLIETDNNGFKNDGEQSVEQDTQCSTDTDRLKGLPSNYEDQVDDLETSENVLKNKKHHSVEQDFQCAIQAEWLKDLPLLNVSEMTALVTSPDGNDSSKTKEQCSRKRKSSHRFVEMDWIKDLPVGNENRHFKTEASLEKDITPAPKAKDPTQTTTKQKKKRKSKRQKFKWSFKLPHDVEDKRRESIMKWTEDLPLDIKNVSQESVMKWIEDLPLDIENKRQDSIIKWTEDLPLDIEKTPASLQKPLPEHNTSQVDKTAVSTNQCVDEENNEDQSVNDLTYNSEQAEETHGTSSQSKNKIDLEGEALSRKLTNKKETQKIKKKSSDESPSHSKITDFNPSATQEEGVRDDDCEKGKKDLKEEKEERSVDQEESERGSRGSNQRNNRHKECEGQTSPYDANEDMTDGLKRKTRKTKQKECEENKDDSHKLSESIGHETDGETSYGVSDMENGNKGKKKKTKKEYKKSKDNSHVHSGNNRHEKCVGETSCYGASDMEAGSNGNRKSKIKILERDITPVPEASSPSQTTTKQKKRKRQEMKWTEDLPLDIENIRHALCEGETSHHSVSDMEIGSKRKKRKTKQKEHEKDKDNEENVGNIGHECERETSYGASDMGYGSKRKKKWTKQKEYERETTDNQEASGNTTYEVCEEERYFSVGEENIELKASQREKDSPYKVETIWHSSSDLTVTTSKHKSSTSNKRALSEYIGRPSKRQKVESSTLGSKCSTPSDQNFSITVCNQVASLSNIRITLCRSPGRDGTASTDSGIKVQVQFSDKHSMTGGGELCTPEDGQDGSVDLRQSLKSRRGFTPHRSQSRAKKRKLFEDDSS